MACINHGYSDALSPKALLVSCGSAKAECDILRHAQVKSRWVRRNRTWPDPASPSRPGYRHCGDCHARLQRPRAFQNDCFDTGSARGGTPTAKRNRLAGTDNVEMRHI